MAPVERGHPKRTLAAQAKGLTEHLQQGAAIKIAEAEHECSLLCRFPLQGCYDCNRFVTILQMQWLEGQGGAATGQKDCTWGPIRGIIRKNTDTRCCFHV